ncbi:hypothetical protein [Zhenhengia sp.]|uniref:hypothetical protein n=1 Tax=Zhenhengia sp. TaxID=2944208 RepID=UPI003079D0DD
MKLVQSRSCLGENREVIKENITQVEFSKFLGEQMKKFNCPYFRGLKVSDTLTMYDVGSWSIFYGLEGTAEEFKEWSK